MEQIVFVPSGVKDCQVLGWLQPDSPQLSAGPYPAMVICPGGGYLGVSDREAEPVAQQYYAAGFSTFVLTYSVGERARNFEPLSQLAATVAYVRKNAEKLRIDPEKVAVIGFSAGGHLAGSLAMLYDDAIFLEAFPQTENIRPDAVILSYPVITADKFTHRTTLENVSGGVAPDSPEYAYWGLDTHVDNNTPPTFLWHTAEDPVVPVENSLALAAALSKAKVPFECHVFPAGGHGMSVCTQAVGAEDPYNARWVSWSIAWLKRQLGLN